MLALQVLPRSVKVKKYALAGSELNFNEVIKQWDYLYGGTHIAHLHGTHTLVYVGVDLLQQLQ